MPKDYQEVERIVEEIITTIDDNLSLIVGEENEWYEVAECKTEMRAKLKQALTTYGNAREEEIIKIAEGMKPNSTFDPYVDGYNDAKRDLIEAIKK